MSVSVKCIYLVSFRIGLDDELPESLVELLEAFPHCRQCLVLLVRGIRMMVCAVLQRAHQAVEVLGGAVKTALIEAIFLGPESTLVLVCIYARRAIWSPVCTIGHVVGVVFPPSRAIVGQLQHGGRVHE